MVWIVVIGYALIVLLDFLPLVRRKKWRAAAAFICVFLIALTLEVLTVSHVEIPSVLSGLARFVRWLGMGYSV